MGELLTTKEAAQALTEGLGKPVSPRNVLEAVKRGRLKGTRSGDGSRSPYLIPEEEVRKILEEKRPALDARRLREALLDGYKRGVRGAT